MELSFTKAVIVVVGYMCHQSVSGTLVGASVLSWEGRTIALHWWMGRAVNGWVLPFQKEWSDQVVIRMTSSSSLCRPLVQVICHV